MATSRSDIQSEERHPTVVTLLRGKQKKDTSAVIICAACQNVSLISVADDGDGKGFRTCWGYAGTISHWVRVCAVQYATLARIGSV